MSYSDFNFDELKSQFSLKIQEVLELFPSAEPLAPSALLRETLEENLPLAFDVDTEKARSELIVSPILVEIRKHYKRQISLFSGTEFNIDPSIGLSGRCDFLISQSPEQLSINAPVAILVEAKNDNIKSGIPQCIAEMLAAQIFNERKKNNIPCIYGAVTTGSLWRFMKLVEKTVYIESVERFIGNLELLLGILSQIIRDTRAIAAGESEGR